MRKYLSILILLALITPVFATTSIYPGNYMNDIDDVSTSGKIVNDLLIWDGTNWASDDNPIVNSITYGANYWDDLRVSLTRARPNPTTSPDYATFIGNTYAWYFDDTDGDERLEFDTQLPHGYCAGEDVPLHIHANSGANSDAGNVEAIIECTTWANPSGGIYGANTVIYNGVAAVDGTTYKNYIFGVGTTSGTGITLSATIYCAISRGVSVGDDVVGDFIFTTADFHVKKCAPGSRQQFVY
jgi:hypothetical protein